MDAPKKTFSLFTLARWVLLIPAFILGAVLGQLIPIYALNSEAGNFFGYSPNWTPIVSQLVSSFSVPGFSMYFTWKVAPTRKILVTYISGSIWTLYAIIAIGLRIYGEFKGVQFSDPIWLTSICFVLMLATPIIYMIDLVSSDPTLPKNLWDTHGTLGDK